MNTWWSDDELILSPGQQLRLPQLVVELQRWRREHLQQASRLDQSDQVELLGTAVQRDGHEGHPHADPGQGDVRPRDGQEQTPRPEQEGTEPQQDQVTRRNKPIYLYLHILLLT